ncbi:hypothetical protein M427DRAFT_60686 [Gonapodya prolifera JEL478]|uniref:Uncharacterized protein n=1 Tax=Gonapodya prolifera (strain JEL478) TaxID=1344416 RepID=A0A139A3R2_GONPJ|nr:hypothetical protein M427DRAFT_60686 [Gonapodya prolifera JEL478]|eukprot:KXS11456.1 hypothetical protein M427DRAFT_60686 [Gonapodya prolifera JEL478]
MFRREPGLFHKPPSFQPPHTARPPPRLCLILQFPPQSGRNQRTQVLVLERFKHPLLV